MGNWSVPALEIMIRSNSVINWGTSHRFSGPSIIRLIIGNDNTQVLVKYETWGVFDKWLSSDKTWSSPSLMKWSCIGSSPELSAFAASCRFRKVAWILVLQIPALLVQNKTHMVNMDEAPNFHKMLKPELKLNTCEAMVQKLLARKLLLFRCSMMASLVLFSLF